MAPPEIELSKSNETKKDGCKPSVLSELLCCPWCGWAATYGVDILTGKSFVRCSGHCEVDPHTRLCENEIEAATIWNHRVI